MKKFIMMMLVAFASVMSMNAQSQMNYAGNSNFTDNWSVSLHGGVLTTFDNFYSGHTAMAPVIALGLDKYITPVVGFGIEGRTLIGTGSQASFYQSHTAFDAVNVSGYTKFNLTNLFTEYRGTRRMFEPVVYTGLGWGHMTDGDHNFNPAHKNYMTWRSGAEFNFNLGRERAWAVVVNPSVVWGNPATTMWATKLSKHNGMFECTAGVVYHFKTSNGSHSFANAHLYDAAEVQRLNDEINMLREELESVPAEVVVERVVEVPTSANVYVPSETVVCFGFNSSVLSEAAKAHLDKVASNTNKVSVVAFASPEGSDEYNLKLSHERAHAVAEYLSAHGVEIVSEEGMGANNSEANRIAIVSAQ